MNGRPRRWPPIALLLAVTAVLGVAGPRAVAQAPSEPDKAVAAATAYCDDIHQKGDAAMSAMNAQIAALDAALAAAAKAPADGPGRAAPAGSAAPAGGAGTTPPASDALAPAAAAALTSAVAEARQLGHAATASHKAAEKALAESRAAKDPVMRAFHLKDAMLKEETAQRLAKQVTESLGGAAARAPAPAGPAGTSGGLGRHTFNESPTLRLLRQMADVSTKTGSAEAWRQAMKEHARPALVGAPAGTTFFGIKDALGVKDYDAATDTVTLANGRTVSVESLRRAATRVDPAIARQPLFEREPPPPGQTMPDTWRLDRRVLAMVASPETRKQLERVGGVALDVTFDVLAFARVAEFRPRGPATAVDSPVLVSLRALQQAASAWATSADRWRGLPDALRFPGSIERIHGFIIEPERGDIVLVGAPAARRERRIDIDALVVGVRAVWRAGQTPAVSLDPLPQNLGGPQYPRVMGVPEGSAFAKVMLDADYAMKRIMIGTLRPAVAGFRNVADLLTAAPTARATGGRFWLTPRPLGPDSIRVAAAGRIVLFDGALEVQTEEGQLAASGAFVGTGRALPEAHEAAARFTAAYAAFEQSPQIEPAAVFTRVRALADIVTVCKLWRDLGDVPLLAAFARLPVVRLTGGDAVPAYYPGLSVRYRRPENEYTLSGGAVMRPRHSRRSLDDYDDPVSVRLTAAARDLARGARVAASVPVTLVLAPARPGESTVTAARIAGETALHAGDYQLARRKFGELTTADPLDTDAWADLAISHARLADYGAATAAIRRALALDPTSTWLKAVALDIAFHSEPAFDVGRADPAVRRELSVDYLRRAAAALTAGDEATARRLADTAIRLADDNGDAYLLRAHTWPTPTSREAGRDWLEAIRRYRARVVDDEDAKRPLAFALAMWAYARLGRLDLAAIRDEGAAQAAVEILQRIADNAREARQLDDASALGVTAEAWARTLRVWLLKLQGHPFNAGTARQLADSAISRFPDFAPAHYVRALIALADGNRGAALRALSEAVRLDPTYADAFLGRAELHVQERRCAEASQDIARARALLRPDDRRPADPRLRCG